MPSNGVSIWKKIPIVRLLIPLVAGILLQWNFQFRSLWLYSLLFVSVFLILIYFFFSVSRRYQLLPLTGIAVSVLFLTLGALLARDKDIRNHKNWLGNFYKETDVVMVRLAEPPVVKKTSLKATADLCFLLRDEHVIPVKGKIILYFKKDSNALALSYGTQVVFKKALQPLNNPGNPGGFNYSRYALFQGITHQVYLAGMDYRVLRGKTVNPLSLMLYHIRNQVLAILRNNIQKEKERGMAEALLIGYKDDLDPELVQSYTNTGVVHIIAISGLHLGLIYGLLVRFCKPLRRRKKLKWMAPLLIISGLWLFSLLAGAQASVLRSAVMFTCIVAGETFSKKSSIINTLALSAFLLLCYNPYWLWDAGFQLSYAAVLSIVIFVRPVYNWLYFQNKFLDTIWKLNAISIAAQVLTVPVAIFQFHQFPNYFLLTNFIAVPLSSAIVLGEIGLCILSVIPILALLTGKIISAMIGLMNDYIQRIESLPFSLWDGLEINSIQAIFLFVIAACGSYWLLSKSKTGFMLALLSSLGFISCRSISFLQKDKQQILIVYNIPRRQALDFISGRTYYFRGDTDLVKTESLFRFYLKPSHGFFRTSSAGIIKDFIRDGDYISFHGKHILFPDQHIVFAETENRPVIDLLMISKNSEADLEHLSKSMNIKQVILDSSLPAWKAEKCRKECDSLQLPCYDVSASGAFILQL